MSEWKLKRFWTEAGIVATDDGYQVVLDGRGVKTPNKAALTLPSRALAEATAAEWAAQGEEVDFATMPVNRAANTAIDAVREKFDAVADDLANYGTTDLLCYRADRPEELIRRQAEAWDPLLDWAEARLGARLVTAHGVMYVPQDEAALERLGAQVRALDHFAMTGFSDLVTLSGSLVLGFAVLEGARSPEDAWQLSRIDEDWQAEQWGVDDEAQAMADYKKRAFLDAARFVDLSRAD